MRKIKKALSILIVLSILSSAFCITSFASASQRITVGDEIWISSPLEQTFVFTPEEDGYYTFKSESVDWDPACVLLDSDGETIAGSDDVDVGNNNFMITAELEKGKTYYFQCETLSCTGDGYTVFLNKSRLADSIEIVRVIGADNYIATYTAYIVKCYPEGSVCPPLEWTVDDESVARIEGYDNSACGVLNLSVGETILRAESSIGLSATYKITVEWPPVIKKDEVKSLSFDWDTMARYFSFIPEESGYYCFEGTGDYYLEVYDDEFNSVASAMYSEEAERMFANAYLEAGERYIITTGIGYDYDYAEYEICVSDCVEAEGAYIHCEYERIVPGTTVEAFAVGSPYNSIVAGCEWSISDSSIATITAGGDTCNINFIKAGAVEVTLKFNGEIVSTVELYCEEIETINLSEKKEIEPQDPEGHSFDKAFAFIPEESGYYVFMSEGNEDYFAELWYGDFEYQMCYSDDYHGENDDYNFVLQAWLEEGELYYVNCGSYSCWENYTVTVEKGTEPENIYLRLPNESYVGNEFEIIAYSDNKTDILGNIMLYSDDEDIVYSAEFNGNSVYVNAVNAGTCNIWAETESGLVSEKVSVTVENITYIDLVLNEKHEDKIGAGRTKYYTFTPEESGLYCFYSEFDYGDLRADLLDEYGGCIADDDDGGYGLNFKIEEYLQAGETYTLRVFAFEWEDIDEMLYSVCVSDKLEVEGVRFDVDETVMAEMGDYFCVGLAFEPIYTYEEISELIVENEEVVIFSGWYDDNVEFFAIDEGEAKVTVKTVSGFEASFTIIVYDPNGDDDSDILRGDLNGDGEVNAIDANIMKRYIAGAITDICFENGDVNADGRVDSIDSNLLKRLIAGM